MCKVIILPKRIAGKTYLFETSTSFANVFIIVVFFIK